MPEAKKVNLKILPAGKIIKVPQDYNLKQAILDSGIDVESSCGGAGTCGKCIVKVISGNILSQQSSINPAKNKKGFILSCLSTIAGDAVIELRTRKKAKGKIDEGSLIFETGKIYSSISTGELLEVEISPWIKKFNLHVEEPSMFYNTSDIFRLNKSISEYLNINNIGMTIPTHVLRKVPVFLRKNNWEVTVSMDTSLNIITNLQPGNLAEKCFGIAIDIGTTTIVIYLVDILKGNIVGAVSEYNPQIKYGEDIINRIVFSLKDNGLEKLNCILMDIINSMLSDLLKNAGVDPEDIVSVMVSGNPTMIHIFFKVSPRFIREMPYITVSNKFPASDSKDLGFKNLRNAVVNTMPGVSSYLGGDITAGILATNMAKGKETTLLIDLGTNGELVIGNSDWMMGCSCSAGPAFEGGGVKCGIRAVDGAIEKVVIKKGTLDCHYEVIGGKQPIGICGSGLIDLISEMFLKGVIDRRGKFEKSIENRNLKIVEDEYRYIVSYARDNSSNEDIYISEVDIENLIRAKAAIYAGIKTLIEDVDLKVGDIEKIYIAGGLGKNINIKSAIIIGMLPDINTSRYSFLGNTSIAGCYLALLSRERFEFSEKIANSITYIDLSASMKFMERYVAGIFLPYTELKDFPSVETLFFQ